MSSHRSKPVVSEPLISIQEMMSNEISSEMNDLRNKKKDLLQQIDDIDSLFIGYREELRRRKELERLK